MSQQLQPQQRIDALDIIRGFAIFGIFFVNIPEMAGNGIMTHSSYEGADALIRLFYDMFVQTKFYTIFSFLFGLGFYLFMQSAERRGLRTGRLFSRRLAILFAIGGAHFILLWFGDILHTYAMFGFLLLLFYKRAPKTILIWSITLLSLFAVTTVLTTILIANIPEYMDTPSPYSGYVAMDLSQRFGLFLTSGLPNSLAMSFEVLGLFLLGLYAGKQRWFEQISQHNARIRQLQWATLILSVLIFIPMLDYYRSASTYEYEKVYHYTFLSGKTMAVFYVCTLLRLIQRFGAQRFSGMAAVGRMALTNYLSHTIITMLVLGVFWTDAVQAPLWAGTVYCTVFLLVQVAWSKAWFRYFRMGPAEWLWRAGTYWQLPPLRRSHAHTQAAPSKTES
ncbi:DUF418 domain-containing protein [Paenibacillus sp. 481]|uniref:DUF418 domain-containing protein n=1 Tax=Paenibacillus sp. 481 TaxID=2835869 RepID=UPI001E2C7236|nr:DUF418 domain-containing protein [Paenibacillus sp. 481]UHA75559.1 DUF418 domain-containing protein [Paenibacillus sp. 481]